MSTAPFLTRYRWPLALGAAVLFTLLIVEELATSDEPFTWYALCLELLEFGLLIGCTVLSVLLALQGRAQAQEQAQTSACLREELHAVRTEGARWREAMAAQLQGFSTAIQQQFILWRLSRAEQDVGLLLLKGFSHKEIARMRRTGEATIRQQAASIYAKAGVGGRAALAAYFLDGLHLPDPAPGVAEERPRPEPEAQTNGSTPSSLERPSRSPGASGPSPTARTTSL